MGKSFWRQKMGFFTLYSEIVKRLESGSIKNVMVFGDSFDRPAPPYVVVKSVPGVGRKLLQIIIHTGPGMQDVLEEYIFRELPTLLKAPLEKDGKRVTVYSTSTWLGPFVDEGDNTLAMSRDFFIPVII
jgi:hypothetical protein